MGMMVTVNNKQISCKPVKLASHLMIQVPEQFDAEKIDGRYLCLGERSGSLPGFALRFAPLTQGDTREKMVRSFFGGENYSQPLDGVFCRESRHGTDAFSVYLMRFAVQVSDGLLLGCFNCESSQGEGWREAVLQILGSAGRENPA